MKNQKGFNLIELVIGMAIVGTLGSLAMNKFDKYNALSKRAQVKLLLTFIHSGEKNFHAEWKMYYPDFGVIGFVPEGEIYYNAGFTATVASARVPLPAGYSGPPAARHTSTFSYCEHLNTCTHPSERNKLHAYGFNDTYTDQRTFLAIANGDIDNDPSIDTWTLDHKKNMQVYNNNDLDN